jgi:hypothetical protein
MEEAAVDEVETVRIPSAGSLQGLITSLKKERSNLLATTQQNVLSDVVEHVRFTYDT